MDVHVLLVQLQVLLLFLLQTLIQLRNLLHCLLQVLLDLLPCRPLLLDRRLQQLDLLLVNLTLLLYLIVCHHAPVLQGSAIERVIRVYSCN